MIYKLNHDFENTYSFLVDPVELVSKMPNYRPRQKAKPLLDGWVTPEASFYASENFILGGEQIPDVTTWKLGYLVLNKKAYGSLHKCLSGAGEFLPVYVKNIEYFIFNPLYVIADSAVNKTNAVEVIDSGVHLGQGNILFDESMLDKDNISVFKTNTDQLVFSYCTEQFKKLYENYGCKGLVFESV
jgi:hypothetical protein